MKTAQLGLYENGEWRVPFASTENFGRARSHFPRAENFRPNSNKIRELACDLKMDEGRSTSLCIGALRFNQILNLLVET